MNFNTVFILYSVNESWDVVTEEDGKNWRIAQDEEKLDEIVCG